MKNPKNSGLLGQKDFSSSDRPNMVFFSRETVYWWIFLCEQKKSARAEEYIRMIKDRLPEAVQQCIHAAAGEHEPAVQRSLLRVSRHST